ncbi:hypothetical protein HNP84_006537 [Thermocatellispora tengchongensis]|uniref:Serine/threonine protein kinase n=1 Tax=Thermocatellispora tengchongensis TaxID=1073253 RepID=A0A840PDI4_9ACTN|nr:hypothetical protein [Thermocatellispora tengchongensis]MBB5136786.1 hypothetical protein [Thermocatellispora tengchongensis]
MKITRWAAAGMTLAAVAALTLAPSAPAQALPQGSCGNSYRKVATYPLVEGAKGGEAHGTVTLYHSRTAHRKCAIARVARSYIGRTSYLYVELFVDRNGNKEYDGPDTGVADGSPRYKWFAGPVYAPADGLCVRFAGAVRIGSKPAVHGGTPDGEWKHCG